ncbi:hypothetical protein [Streptomyces sp. NPDC026092]|uniref:hypothetical protein n=1 Tax=Streptomyces sp. NPDC026092 TaxID=3154797 RepID=UPI0033F7F5F7
MNGEAPARRSTEGALRAFSITRAAAVESGLHVPETLITNDPADVAPFAEYVGGHIITKVLGGIVHTEDGKRGQLYTRRVPTEQLTDPRIALTAHLFQREITDKADEIRVAVVDGQLFPGEHHRARPRLAVRPGRRSTPDRRPRMGRRRLDRQPRRRRHRRRGRPPSPVVTPGEGIRGLHRIREAHS